MVLTLCPFRVCSPHHWFAHLTATTFQNWCDWWRTHNCPCQRTCSHTWRPYLAPSPPPVGAGGERGACSWICATTSAPSSGSCSYCRPCTASLPLCVLFGRRGAVFTPKPRSPVARPGKPNCPVRVFEPPTGLCTPCCLLGVAPHLSHGEQCGTKLDRYHVLLIVARCKCWLKH